MSQENVDVLRAFFQAWEATDMDAALELCDPEVEVDWSRSRGLEARTYRGHEHEGIRGFWNYTFGVFDRLTVSLHELIECGEHVVVPNRTHFWGRNGVAVEAQSVFVLTLRNRRIIEWRLFQEIAEALEAVGLSDQDAHADS
jgi:ketosteroid isomerase-like protein